MPRKTAADAHLASNIANPPPTTYYPTTRNRANTINQMDVIPPALARLTHLGPADPAGTRSSLTPVLNRDEAIQEWERRNATGMGHAKRPSMANPGNPQLEFLQEQAELHHNAWANPASYGSGGRHSMNGNGYTMQPPPPVMVDGHGRSGQHRPTISTDYASMPPTIGAASVPNSPRHPSSSHSNHHYSQSSGHSLLPAFPPPAASAFDSFDSRVGDLSAMGYPSGIRHSAQPSGSSQQAMIHQGNYDQGMTRMQSMEQQMAQLPTSPQRYQQVRRRSGQNSQGGNSGFGMYEA